MTTEYTFKVVSVFPDSKGMLLEFSAEGHRTMVVGTPLPYVGETVADVAARYAPFGTWEHEAKETFTPAVGETGVSTKDVRQPEQFTPEQEALMQRNVRLFESDWTQLPDVHLTAEQKAVWATYRQALRDVTDQDGFPSNVLWPQMPA